MFGCLGGETISPHLPLSLRLSTEVLARIGGGKKPSHKPVIHQKLTNQSFINKEVIDYRAKVFNGDFVGGELVTTRNALTPATNGVDREWRDFVVEFEALRFASFDASGVVVIAEGHQKSRMSIGIVSEGSEAAQRRQRVIQLLVGQGQGEGCV